MKKVKVKWRWRLQTGDDQGVVFVVGGIACQNWVRRKWFSVPGQLPLANQSLLTSSAASHYNFHPPSSWPNPAPPPAPWRSVNFDTKLPPFSAQRLSAPLPSAEYAFSSSQYTNKTKQRKASLFWKRIHFFISYPFGVLGLKTLLISDTALSWADVVKTDGHLYPKIGRESCGGLQLVWDYYS